MENKKEFILNIVKGEKPHRTPVSVWRHFYDLETTPEGLARAMVDFQKKHDWDFMKVNPRACYHAETFGAKYKMSTDPLKNQERIGSPIQGPLDWLKVKSVSLSQEALAGQLKALRMIRKEFGDGLCVIQTVFHPFSIASDLLGSPKDLIPHYQYHWPKLKNGLEAITETFLKYVRAMLKERLVDGIFFAIKDWGTADLINDAEYGEVARPFDLAVLEEARAGEFNVLHVCKSNNRLFSFLDYPVHGFNWDSADKTNPGLREAAAKTDKLLIGGMAHRGSILSGPPEDVKQERACVLKETEGLKFILGAGCTVSVETPDGNLNALR
ncbi:MAG: hypothetical protein HZA01_06370 [Nitrospinae bacterium]|nr:hypothetical protein [Nitrospinota bacterium]